MKFQAQINKSSAKLETVDTCNSIVTHKYIHRLNELFIQDAAETINW